MAIISVFIYRGFQKEEGTKPSHHHHPPFQAGFSIRTLQKMGVPAVPTGKNGSPASQWVRMEVRPPNHGNHAGRLPIENWDINMLVGG